MGGKHSMVAGLSDADMVWLLSIGKLRTMKPGERLVDVGRPVNDLSFVIRGRLAVLLPDETRVALLSEGEVIGEMSFVNQRLPAVTVRAEERSEVLMIPRGAILERFEREPVFAARFYRAIAMFLSERLRETTAAVGAHHEEEEAQAAAHSAGERFRSLVGLFIGKDRAGTPA